MTPIPRGFEPRYQPCVQPSRNARPIPELVLDQRVKAANISIWPLAVESMLTKQAAFSYPPKLGGTRACMLPLLASRWPSDHQYPVGGAEYARKSMAGEACTSDVSEHDLSPRPPRLYAIDHPRIQPVHRTQ
jgi:hypothetical protein